MKEGANTPSQVVAFINTELNTSNLSNLVETGLAVDVAPCDEDNTNFAMTNSGYFDETGKYVAAAKVGTIYTKDQITVTDISAMDEADINVERLAAKISVKNASTVKQDPNYIIKDVAENEVTLKFTPTHWGATGKAIQEYLVKKSYTKTDQEVWKGNENDENRTDWAEGVSYGEDFSYYYADGQPTGVLEYIKYSGLEDMTEVGEENVEYVREHTTKLGIGGGNIIANTYALVTGNYEVVYGAGTDNSTWFQVGEKEYDFYLLLSGDEGGKSVYTMYNKSQLIGLLLDYNGIKSVKVSGDETEHSTTQDHEFDFSKYLDLKYDGSQSKYLLVANEEAIGTLTKSDDDSEINVAELTKGTNARNYYYENGSAYFNAPILHQAAADGGTPAEDVYGVVRNHYYALTITEINNLGAPVNGDVFGPDDPNDPNDDKPIIPNPEDLKDNFIKAKITVYDWHQKDSNVKL